MVPIDPRITDLLKDSSTLIPAIVQDIATNDVLMLAYMNLEALQITLSTGRATYWSRSRGEIWVKGLTSGHFQDVHSIMLDCDGDALLLKVRQIDVACHTGAYSCFHIQLEGE